MGGGKGKKWTLWRSSSSGSGGGVTTLSEGTKVRGRLSEAAASDSPFMAAAMATVVRAPARDFMVVRRQWAAIRIQTVFRAFLVIILLNSFRFFVTNLVIYHVILFIINC